jgi:hypothetical protein
LTWQRCEIRLFLVLPDSQRPFNISVRDEPGYGNHNKQQTGDQGVVVSKGNGKEIADNGNDPFTFHAFKSMEELWIVPVYPLDTNLQYGKSNTAYQ